MMSKSGVEPGLMVKRVYAPVSEEDGRRFLVDRLWPRGVSKENARIDGWLKDLAPSHDLRRRFRHDPEQWDDFLAAYFEELDAQPEAVADLRREAAKGPVTLIYAARDEQINNAVALKVYLQSGRGGPPPD